MFTMSVPIFLFIWSGKIESSCSTRSASTAWPTASWMNTPVRLLSATIVKRPDGAGFASNSSVAFSPIFLPKDSMSASCNISNPLTPPKLPWLNWMSSPFEATAFNAKATLELSTIIVLPSVLTNALLLSPSE